MADGPEEGKFDVCRPKVRPVPERHRADLEALAPGRVTVDEAHQ